MQKMYAEKEAQTDSARETCAGGVMSDDLIRKVLNQALPLYTRTDEGLTKRELAAMMAMQGLLAAVYSSKEMLNEFTKEKYVPEKAFGSYVTGCEAISQNAVSYADALLAELSKQKAPSDD